MAKYTPTTSDHKFTFTASGAVTAGKCVVPTGTGLQVKLPGADAANVVGVAAFDAANGKPVTVHEDGIHKLTAAAAITAGDYLVATATGDVKPAANANDAHAFLALEDAAVNEIVRALKTN